MKAAEKQSLRLFCGKNRLFGPSDWFRTSGLVVPNHALYHLSYTRIFNFLILPLWSKMWSSGGFRSFCGSHEVPKLQCLQGVAGFRILPDRRGCYTLPKQARYQLRYTRSSSEWACSAPPPNTGVAYVRRLRIRVPIPPLQNEPTLLGFVLVIRKLHSAARHRLRLCLPASYPLPASSFPKRTRFAGL